MNELVLILDLKYPYHASDNSPTHTRNEKTQPRYELPTTRVVQTALHSEAVSVAGYND